MSAAFLTAVLTITSSGCGDGASRCTDCPAMEGRYRMEFADAGTPGECAQLGVGYPEGEPLNITRTVDRLDGTLAGVPLLGSVSAQGSFSLTGSRAATDGGLGGTLSLAGRYAAPVEDGGTARLTGTYTANLSRTVASGPQRCNLNAPFSATRE